MYRGLKKLILLSICLWCVIAQRKGADKGRDFYKILDIKKNASPADIKKAYRKLSMKYHPDKNPDNPLAVQEFIKLTKAYSVSCFKLEILIDSHTDSHRRSSI